MDAHVQPADCTITEPARTTNFTYDGNGNMLTKSVTDGTHTSTWTYTYDGSGKC